MDGELVVDKLSNGGTKLRYLAYDILAENDRSLLDLNFADRLIALKSRVLAPQKEYMEKKTMQVAFEVKLKQMYRCCDVKYVLEKDESKK